MDREECVYMAKLAEQAERYATRCSQCSQRALRKLRRNSISPTTSSLLTDAVLFVCM